MQADDIARIVARVLDNLKDAKPLNAPHPAARPARRALDIPVGVSARHVHLTQAHVEQLFGPGHQLRPKKTLMGGQFAAEEQVTLVGTALRAVENVRVLGPARSASQVEVSRTDCLRLGVPAPLRESGDLAGSAPIALVGPKGAVYLEEGLIVAARHIHMGPTDAEAAGLADGDRIRVKGQGPRGATFEQVLVRVRPDFTLEMHIDTDEANALGIQTGDVLSLTEGCG